MAASMTPTSIEWVQGVDMVRSGLLVAAVALLAVSAACSNGTEAQSPADVAPSAAVQPHAAPSNGLTGYGAIPAVWNSTHTEDHEFAPSSVFDADPALPNVNGHTGAKYTAVDPGDRITSYDVNFLPLPLSAAKDLLGHEFPADASVLWTQTANTCVQVEYTSPTLRSALGHNQPGDAFVEFSDVQPDGSSASQPTQFNEAIVMPLPGGQPDPSFSC
jgi:hypothetical protein